MRKLKCLFLATAASAVMATATFAQDMGSGYGYPWGGFYAGVVGSYQFEVGDTGQYQAFGPVVGYNHLTGNVLTGVEGVFRFWAGEGFSGTEAHLMGRLGQVHNNILIYGTAGVGIEDGTDLTGSIGVGTEFAMTESTSVRLASTYYAYADGSTPFAEVTAGFFWHFGK